MYSEEYLYPTPSKEKLSSEYYRFWFLITKKPGQLKINSQIFIDIVYKSLLI